jgi:hypothetical protein
MAARVTQHVIEVLLPVITRSPATPTGAGVTQHVLEAVISAPGAARVTQHVIEAVIAFNPDGSHGEPGGCPDPEPGGGGGTRIYGWG